MAGAPWSHAGVRDRMFEFFAWGFCSKEVAQLTDPEARDVELMMQLMEQVRFLFFFISSALFFCFNKKICFLRSFNGSLCFVNIFPLSHLVLFFRTALSDVEVMMCAS